MYEKEFFKKYNTSIWENNISLYTRNTKVYRWYKGSKKDVWLFNEVFDYVGNVNVFERRKVTKFYRNSVWRYKILRLIPKFRESYPRLPVRIIAGSLYPSKKLIELCEEEKIEYILILKEQKIPNLLEDFFALISLSEGNREITRKNLYKIICLFKKYKRNKSNIYNHTDNTFSLTNNRTFRYMWRFRKKIWKRKSISKKVLRSPNRKTNKHRTYSNEDTNTLR